MGEGNWYDKMEQTLICDFFDEIPILTKNITTFYAPTNNGKTITAIKISDNALKNGWKVIYYDAENKVWMRPEPNLLKKLFSSNPELYKNNFKLLDKFLDKDDNTINKIKKDYEEFKPNLIIIDGIYSEFFPIFDHPRERAKEMGIFIQSFRKFIFEKNISAVITTKQSKDNTILGGSEILFNSDSKIEIRHISEKHQILYKIDFLKDLGLKIETGGELKKDKKEK